MSELTALGSELGVSERTLRRAVKLGTLHASRPSQRTLRIELAELRYIRRRWPLLAALRGALRTAHDVRFALLFGSAARGSDRASSDVDVLIDAHHDDLAHLIDLERKLSEPTGRRIDLLRLSDAESDPLLLEQILTDGRVLVDRDGIWPELQRQIRRRGRRAHQQRPARVRNALQGIDSMLAAGR